MPKPNNTAQSENRRWQQASRDQRRDLITDAALKLLHKKGLNAVTMRAVAEQLGIGAMTLYTYVNGKSGLHREMVRRGFQLLHTGCDANSTLDTTDPDSPRKCWRGGARAYLNFALENPNLYKLMFDQFMAAEDHDLLHGGFQNLFDKVRSRMHDSADPPIDLDRAARASAGRFWIALHGLAMISIAGRLGVLEGGLEELLDDLIEHVAPPV